MIYIFIEKLYFIYGRKYIFFVENVIVEENGS